jgi:hypothetical protein
MSSSPAPFYVSIRASLPFDKIQEYRILFFKIHDSYLLKFKMYLKNMIIIPNVTGIKKYSKIGNDSAVKTATMLQ